MSTLSPSLSRPATPLPAPAPQRNQTESLGRPATPPRTATSQPSALQSAQRDTSSFSASPRPGARPPTAISVDAPQVQADPEETLGTLRLAPGGGGLAPQPAQAASSAPQLAQAAYTPGIPPEAQGPRAPGSVEHDPESALTEDERQEALALIYNSGFHESSAEFVRELGDPAAQAEFIRLAIEEGLAPTVFTEFDNASTPERQRAVANALNAAYERGIVKPEDLQELLQEPGDTNRQNLGEVFRLTGNPELINAFLDSELASLGQAQDSSEEYTRSQAISQALAGLPPEDFQAFLAEHSPGPNGAPWSDELAKAFSNLSDAQEPVVAQLFEKASLVEPPTEQSLALFDTLVPHIGNSAEARTKATTFFINHSDELLATTGAGRDGALTTQEQQVLSSFFASTLFTEPPPANRDTLQDHLFGILGPLHDSLAAIPDDGTYDVAQREQARRLGSLVGTLEQGLKVAAERVGAENAAEAGGVDLLFTLANALPSLPIPFGDELQSAGLDGLRNWLVGQLENPPPNPDDHFFHQIFGEGFDHPGVGTDYDAGRGGAHDNANN